MKTIIINEKPLQYVKLPLQAWTYDKDGWGGRSNLLASNETTKRKASLKDLDDCFAWMKKWMADDDYQYGYVIDFSTRTIYYDSEEALAHILQKKVPKRNWDGFFKTFVQKDFSK